jgi:hypothetical protein
MNWKIWVALMIVACLLLACWGSSVILSKLHGNSVSFFLADFSAKLHAACHFPGSDYKVTRAWYDDKPKTYCVRLSSASSPDSSFSLAYNHIGVLVYNSYEEDVINKENTAIRLSSEYGAKVKDSLTSIPNFTMSFYQGRLDWKTADHPRDGTHCIISNELDLDGVYDLAELGSKAGILSINIQAKSADAVTIENLAEILLSIRETLDQANLPFYTIACRFYYSDHNDIRVSGLLYEDIYEEDFETRIYDALII